MSTKTTKGKPEAGAAAQGEPAKADQPDSPNLKEAANVPDWFNPQRHVRATDGIFDHATGELLDEDGKPRSPALRALREREAAAETNKEG